MFRRASLLLPTLLVLIVPTAPGGPARADVPYPLCADAGCSDPADFGSYLFLGPGEVPNDFNPAAGSSWKYNPGTGMDVPGAWQISTGRPDVVIAVLDSGIKWDAADIAAKVALNTGELPLPDGCVAYDCNADGFVSVADYAGVPDHNANGLLDGQDLIIEFSDGVDDDANGYVDDIAGWDFQDDDNDPNDRVRYGHGTGEAEDSTGEANNGSGLPGVAPNAMFMPLKVADSFVAIGVDFAQAVVYAVDNGAAVVQEALGAINASKSSQDAIDYAYRRGVPIMASAADEESRHHNFPAALDHTIWLNSIVHGDGSIVEQEDTYDLLNGCTNFGGRAWVAIPSNSCSSEATGRGSGLAALIVSHGRNLVDAGLLSPYPGLTAPFSAEEVRQLLRTSASDVDHAGLLDDLTINGLISFLLSADGLFPFGSKRFPTQPGWDQFTGYGKPDAAALLAGISPTTIPPEADLSGGLRWFDMVDPVATPQLPVIGSAAAVRAPGDFSWTLEVGCGIQPQAWDEIGQGVSGAPVVQGVLGTLDGAATAQGCGFDPSAATDDPDGHTVTLRLRVQDDLGNVGIDRRTIAIHHDAGQKLRLQLGASVEGATALADVNRDGVLDVIVGTSGGEVFVLDIAAGDSLPGFPVTTDAIAIHPSPGYTSGEVHAPRESVLAALAADDLDGDGTIEIVAASIEGALYVFDAHGNRRPGFPVRTDPALSDPVNRDSLNDTDPGIASAPTLVDLDPPGVDPALEIVFAGLDGHLYAFRADGQPMPGFPVRIADRSKVSIDPATGKATALVAGVQQRGAKIIGSPAVGDISGDGIADILIPTNEEYANEPNGFALEGTLTNALGVLASQLGEDLDFSTRGRLYAIAADGSELPGWPIGLPLVTPGILPTVGTGTPGSPALAPLGPGGELVAAIFATAGPAMLVDGTGAPFLGEIGGKPRAFATDFPLSFPIVPATAGSPDAPFFPGLGSGAFGDVTGDGAPEYVAPTMGLRKLIDVLAPAKQGPGDHQVTAWDPTTGAVLPAFPNVMDDMQFLATPALADVDGDGIADVLSGSGGYLLRAYRSDGGVPAGFPKFTHGWLISTPSAGDVDGDGLIEIVAATRAGFLFVWDTLAPATEAAIPWQGFGRDRRNTQNLASGVSPLAPPLDPAASLLWVLESIDLELAALVPGSQPQADAIAWNRLVLGAVIGPLRTGDARPALVLPFAIWGLEQPVIAPLLGSQRQRLLDAVAATGRAMGTCAGQPAPCPHHLAKAEALAGLGDVALAAGEQLDAAWLFSRAIASAARP